MEIKNIHKIVAGVAVAAIIVPGLVLASKKLIGPSAVNCEAGNSCAITVNVPPSQAIDDGEQLGLATRPEDFTDLTGLRLSGDLQVNGTSTFVGTSTISILGENGVVPYSASSTMSATSTACDITNTSGRVRVITDLVLEAASTSNVGTFRIVAGTSTNGFVTSTSPIINDILVTANTGAVITPTSTLRPSGVATTSNGGVGLARLGYLPWAAGEHLSIKVASTTLQGICRVSWL